MCVIGMPQKSGLFVLLVACLAGLIACERPGKPAGGGGGGGADASEQDEENRNTPKVVATTSMIADMVSSVAGDAVEVIGLMGPGVDPHDYTPRASDVSAMNQASAIFYNGLLLEGRMSELFDKLSASGKPVFALASAVPQEKLIAPEEDGAHHDPHLWGDVRIWSQCVQVVVDGLAEVFPEQAEAIRSRGAEVVASYQELDRWAAARLATIPKEKRYLITSHDAFAYLGRAYGLEVIGVEGISTVGEAGIADIVKMIDVIVAKQVPAIFVETASNPDAIRRIASDSGAVIGGELFADATGNAW